MWRSEDKLKESVFSLHHLGPRIPTQGLRLGSRRLYVLSHHGGSLLVLVGDNWQHSLGVVR